MATRGLVSHSHSRDRDADLLHDEKRKATELSRELKSTLAKLRQAEGAVEGYEELLPRAIDTERRRQVSVLEWTEEESRSAIAWGATSTFVALAECMLMTTPRPAPGSSTDGALPDLGALKEEVHRLHAQHASEQIARIALEQKLSESQQHDEVRKLANAELKVAQLEAQLVQKDLAIRKLEAQIQPLLESEDHPKTGEGKRVHSQQRISPSPPSSKRRSQSAPVSEKGAVHIAREPPSPQPRKKSSSSPTPSKGRSSASATQTRTPNRSPGASHRQSRTPATATFTRPSRPYPARPKRTMTRPKSAEDQLSSSAKRSKQAAAELIQEITSSPSPPRERQLTASERASQQRYTANDKVKRKGLLKQSPKGTPIGTPRAGRGSPRGTPRGGRPARHVHIREDYNT